ncbi:MAG: RHS repeat-associated core domain-containing protein, partial [Geodermatophilaceae bacterium]|nr:RHS repeat-associated core domain-containing protein [Geodermatophilaceae bacterium]
NRRAFFVTDGQGRQYVVADQNGADLSATLDYTQNGGKYAGGTQNASSFGADRHGSASVPGLSFFRNRVYDQATGRWTQEDPIGVAGGVNLYQFNGNNPVTFTDPFGLKECEQRGNCTQGDGGEMEARGVAMRRSDVIVSTDASPLFFIGGMQSKTGGAAVRLAGPAAATEAKVLAEFFGQRAAGALARLESMTLTPGITREMLERYGETVARPIMNGTAPAGKITERALETQSARLDLIVAALKNWF